MIVSKIIRIIGPVFVVCITFLLLPLPLQASGLRTDLHTDLLIVKGPLLRAESAVYYAVYYNERNQESVDEAEEEYEEEQEEPAAADEEEQPQVGETVTEQVVTAAPEQLSQIRFKEYLTDWTTIYYAPEDGDNWQPLAEDKWHSLYGDNWGIRRNGTEDRGLDPERRRWRGAFGGVLSGPLPVCPP